MVLTNSIDIKAEQQLINYRKKLDDDTDIVVIVTYIIEFNIVSKAIQYIIYDSKVYLEKDKNKYHIKHGTRKNKKLIIDKFSLWLAFDLWLPNVDRQTIDNFEFDKLSVIISQ